MEDTLRAFQKVLIKLLQAVLILVLMEDTLRDGKVFRFRKLGVSS